MAALSRSQAAIEAAKATPHMQAWRAFAESVKAATLANTPGDGIAVVDIVMADGLFAKQTMVPRAGSILKQHAHAWDHVSFVSRGAVRVWCDGVMLGDFEAPHGLMIKAGVEHQFGTLADDTVISCIHRIDRTGEIDLTEPGEFDREMLGGEH
jgi:quercetin dioxygenase-like cupin family protein